MLYADDTVQLQIVWMSYRLCRIDYEEDKKNERDNIWEIHIHTYELVWYNISASNVIGMKVEQANEFVY